MCLPRRRLSHAEDAWTALCQRLNYLRLGGRCLGVRGEIFVVAIGSSSCGDTLEGDFEKNN